MTLFFADLVRERSFATGAADLALGGALPGHRRFAEAVPPGARFHYCIAGITHPQEWETGEGEIGSGDTLVRVPLASSSGGDAVNFSPGLKTVALIAAAAWFAAREQPVSVEDVAGLQAALDGKAALAGAAFEGAIAAPELTLGAPLALADGGTGAASAAAARTGLGLAIGTDVQAQDAELQAIAGLDSAADRLPYFTGAGSADLAPFTSFGRSLVDDSDAAAARATLALGTMAIQNAAGVAITGGTAQLTGNSSTTGKLAIGRATVDNTAYLRVDPPNPTRGIVAMLANTAASAQTGAQLLFTQSGIASWSIGQPAAVNEFAFWRSRDAATDGAKILALTATAVNASAGVAYQVNGTQVVSARRTGWNAASGTASRAGFDTASVTTAQLAERVKALIDDLVAHGLIGS